MSENKENFAELLEESLGSIDKFEGSLVKGTVLDIDRNVVVVDVGLKSEGRILHEEFGKQLKEIKPGDIISVYVDKFENKEGEAVLSYEKARREAAWEELEVSYKKGERVDGIILGRVKGGFTVDLSGAIAFLPGSQIDVRPIKDVASLVGVEQPFQILKMDRPRGNIVVSRRAILEESRAEARSEIMANISEGQVMKGVVKNITDYGAFIDLGGLDGLLHVTDISWQRINHPSDVLKVGQTIDVKVIKFSDDNQRISLGMKQLTDDPWASVPDRYKPGQVLDGVVTNVTDYGVFVELEPGIEGLIHVSELSWMKKNLHPNKIVAVSEKVEAKVLEVDMDKRRISLSLRQTTENPWDVLNEKFKVGDVIEGEVKSITEFGVFVSMLDDVDGMVHISDLSWEKSGDEALKEINKGDVVKAKILEIDSENERIALGIKQLKEDPFDGAIGDLKPGSVTTCVVTEVTDNGIEVSVNDDLKGFIRKAELSRDRSEQRPDRFAAEEKVDAQIISIDRKTRKVMLSIKARELSEEREAMKEFGSSDSGASLGDILGASIDLEKVKKAAEKNEAARKAGANATAAKKKADEKEDAKK
jgi:small subunit ribosomal protein S1